MSKIGLHEDRVRVICHLPCKDEPQEHAFYEVIDYLQSQRTAPVPVTGYTHSSLRPNVFWGYWWGRPDEKHDQPRARKKWVPDKIVILIVDYGVEFSDRQVSEIVGQLKAAIVKAYESFKCPQEDFWITAQALIRYA